MTVSSVRTSAGRRPAAAAAAVALVLLAGCSSGTEDQSDLQLAQAQVVAKESALADAEQASADATNAFCASGADYVQAIDRYGDVLTGEAPTVGDVVAGGSDLREPRDEAMSAGQAAQEARETVADAQNELVQAQADLAALEAAAAASAGATVQPVEPSPTVTAVALAPADTVARVKQADSELTDAQRGISDETPLREASQQFNSAAVALEMAWLQLVAQAGCLTDEQALAAQQSIASYTATLQQALTDAGYDAGPVDGIYGPATTAAVQALQKAHGLPETGWVDKATAAALQEDLVAKGGEAAQTALATTAALQQTLHLAGYWDGPIDGEPSDELTAALQRLQTDLGVEPTGMVDAATIAAFEKALTDATAPQPEPEPSDEPSEPEPSATT